MHRQVFLKSPLQGAANTGAAHPGVVQAVTQLPPVGARLLSGPKGGSGARCRGRNTLKFSPGVFLDGVQAAWLHPKKFT